MNYLKISVGIFLVLAASRFIPHPPNFTSLIALSFYVPAAFGIRYIPSLLFCYIVTDLFIGFHPFVFFTWGSILVIGLLSKYFLKNIIFRISGALTGATIFYIISNFGVWTSGYYGYTFEGILKCYILAIPFFGYTLVSTFLFSSIIETILKFKLFKTQNINKYT